MNISCFMPLYLILAFKNIIQIINLKNIEDFNWNSFDFIFNVTMLFVWAILACWGSIAIILFKKSFLLAYERASEKILIDSAENITSDNCFTYLSLFVFTFFGIDPTQWMDMIILSLVMVLMAIVYMKNEMWFINPILNIIGYKSFKIIYSKLNNETKQYEIKVFAKENLNKRLGQKCNISYSCNDFSVCYFRMNCI